MTFPQFDFTALSNAEVASELWTTYRRLLDLKVQVILRLGDKVSQVETCAFVQSLETQFIACDADGNPFYGRVIDWVHATKREYGYILAISDVNQRLWFFLTNQRPDGQEYVNKKTWDMGDIAHKYPIYATWCFETIDAALALSD